MADNVCGASYRTREGTCGNRATYPDGKCGWHSDDNPTRPMEREVNDPYIRNFMEEEKRKRKPQTYANRRTALPHYDEYLQEVGKDPRKVWTNTTEGFASWLINEKGVADGTARQYLGSVKEFYDHLIARTKEEERMEDESETNVEENPVEEADFDAILTSKDTERDKLLRGENYALTPEKMKLTIKHAPAPQSRNQLILRMLGGTGCRPEELCNIRLQDVKLEERKVHIRADKTEENRTVWFGEGLATHLRLWIHGGPRDSYAPAADSPYLLVTERSAQISYQRILDVVHEAAENAGLQEVIGHTSAGQPKYKVTPYSYRHGFGNELAGKYDIRTVADLMGHSNTSTTLKHYVKGKEERMREAGLNGIDI